MAGRASGGQRLSQIRVFFFGFDKNGDVGIGVFPKREKILIRCAGLSGLALQRVRAAQRKTRKRSDGLIENDSSMVEDFLEFRRGFTSLMGSQMSLPTHIHDAKAVS